MSIRVGIVGVTGAVGRELLNLLDSGGREFSEVRLLASARSAGQVISGRAVLEASTDTLADLDVVFFSAGSSVSRALRPFVKGVMIDNSSAFRMESDVPLVVPEINFSTVSSSTQVIANPNCVAILLLMAVAPLRKLGRIRRLIVSTYQSASGAGAAAMQELEDQTGAYLAGEPVIPQVLPHPYAFNLFSHNTPLNEHGWNEEEWKVMQESRKILDNPELLMNVTCVRVPVLRAHSESVTIEFFDDAPSEEAVRECLMSAPGVKVVDDRSGNYFPMPIDASGCHETLVGRIRKDLSDSRSLSLFLCGDQLLKGAALNAVQIAEAGWAAGWWGA